MSKRNRYDEAFGVLPMRWELGWPDHYMGIALVEVWSAETAAESHEPTKPQVKVKATREVWIRVNGEWKALGYNGALNAVTPGEVRRHARVASSRSWTTTITLDGWL